MDLAEKTRQILEHVEKMIQICESDDDEAEAVFVVVPAFPFYSDMDIESE